MNTNTIHNIVNDVRVAHSKPELDYNIELAKSAEERANDMCKYNYFEHDRPDGTPWHDTLTYDYDQAAENIAINYRDEPSVVDGWVDSKSHYEAMIGNYKDTGIGVAQCHGRNITVQHFANPVESMGINIVLPLVVIGTVLWIIFVRKLLLK